MSIVKLTRAEAREAKNAEDLLIKKKAEKKLLKEARKEDKYFLKLFVKSIILIIFFFALVLFYAYFIGAKGLVIKEIIIKNDKIPDSFDGFKVVHISDIHYGNSVKKEEMLKIVAKINLTKPDIIVNTGDWLNDYKYSDKEIDEMVNVFSKLEASIGKYTINGNHDYDHDYFEDMIQRSGFLFLDDKIEKIYYEGKIPISLVGLTTNMLGDKNITEKIDPLISVIEQDDLAYNILLLHEPDYIDNINYSYFDLVLSGHTHNGQIRLPYLKPPVLVDGGRKYYDSYYKLNETDLYVSNGVGTSGVPLRLFNRPSVNLFRFAK